jgi:hypothetical protein
MRARTAILMTFSTSLLVLAPCASYAQKPVATFADLQRLVEIGDTLTVSDSSGASSKGRLSGLTASALTLEIGQEQRHFAETDVTRIRQRRQDSLLNGALFGALAGGVIGLMGENSCGNDLGCNSPTGAILALGLGIGVGAGVGIDALITKERTIFDRLSPRGTVTRLIPWVGRGSLGAAVTVGF